MHHRQIPQHVVNHRVHWSFAEQSRQMSKHQTEGTRSKAMRAKSCEWWSVLCVKTEKGGQG